MVPTGIDKEKVMLQLGRVVCAYPRNLRLICGM
jgi:hypothetical protein